MHRTVYTDEQLGSRLSDGDPRILSMIYERYKNGLFLFLVRILSNARDAEDVLQDTFVKVLNERSRLKNPAALKSWVFTIARNEAFAQINLRKHLRNLDDNDENVFVSDLAPTDYEKSERIAVLENMLDKLLPQYKEVLVLREYESMTYEEIAEVTGTTVSSVKSRLFKARIALMKKLEPLRKESAL
jgi:RNA polymerase sigma-70 factor (ECF subfamily)